MGIVADAGQRAAQRRMAGRVSAGGVLTRDGLGLWREARDGDWTAASPQSQVAADLAVLGVPCRTVVAWMFPLAGSRSLRPRKGFEVRVVAKDLAALQVWVPALQAAREGLREDMPGFGFAYFEPRPGAMTVRRRTSLAASWPYWSAEQAGRMGLLCAECGFDLRRRGEGHRAPFNLPTRHGGWRLLCGMCRNHRRR